MTKREAIEIFEEVKMLDDSMFTYSQAYNDALDMAIEALKAQEPRVITNADFENKELVDSTGAMPAWIEYRRGEEWDEYNSGKDDEWAVIYQFNFKSEFYRCWTSRLDEKRRAEIPWE